MTPLQTDDTSEVARGAAPQSFTIIVNPAAGAQGLRLYADIAQALQAQGREVAIELAAKKGDIYDIARAAAADAVLVAGGDGSVNEAAHGLLARSGLRPALGVIPQGTVNVLAQELGLPRRAAPLAAIFARGRRARLSLGLANGRPFVLMASAGVDAAVVAAVDLALKRRIGRFAYLIAAARELLFRPHPDILVETEGEAFAAKCVIVAKSKFYGGRFAIDRALSVLSPSLTLVAVSEASVAALVAFLHYLLTGRLDRGGLIRKMSVRRVRLQGEAVAAQLDGDAFGATPLDVRLCDDTLDIFVP